MSKSPIIILEAGVNHNGSLERALAMVDAAADAGAAYIKFQTFKASALATAAAPKADYQKSSDGRSQREMLAALELSHEAHETIMARCREKGIGFLSSAFDAESIEYLSGLELDYWKVASGEITNLPFLRRIARDGKPVLLSTGMSTLAEVEAAVTALEQAGLGRDRITLLHCTTLYPTPFADVNLRAMEALRSLGCAGVGYSDHTPGIEASVAATALGATVIEKHFTLSRELPGPDHKASLEPAEARALVTAVRNVALALGNGVKAPTKAEEANIRVARKSIVAAREIKEGEVITPEMLACKRPAGGLSPMLWDTVVGSRAVRSFAPDEPIEL